MTESGVYHLAWHRKYVAECDSFPVYVLVPTWLGVFTGSVAFEAINSCGRPLPKVRATVKDLASPRTEDDTEGLGHPLEVQLIRKLGVRAGQAGYVLPQVVPTTKFRGWSRLALSEHERLRLLRAGGVST